MEVNSLISSCAFAIRSCAFAAAVILTEPVWAAESGVAPEEALAAYVQREDDSFAWHERSSGKLGTTQYVELSVTSQTWRGIPWRHQLYLIKPSSAEPDTKQALFVIAGSRWREELERPPGPRERLPGRALLYAQLAEYLRTPMAVMMQVPHQPLFNGLTEDRLIAKTFDEYLGSGESDWPLLLPMVKSVSRGMDVMQEYAAKAWSLDIESFTVTGASKRGWTTWLTGAVEPRAAALAPMVIDMLNLSEHLRHAQDVWGAQSYQIQPYTERRLHERMQEPGGRNLLRIIDPYSYREDLTQPKLIINGTNDEYWPLEALNLYWEDLRGEKYVLYVPNNSHSLDDYGRILGGVVALHNSVTGEKPMPDLEWEYHEDERGVELRLHSKPEPRLIRAWVAESETADMREAKWTAIPLPGSGARAHRLERAKKGYRAMFAEVEYSEGRALPLYLSTTVRMLTPSEAAGADGVSTAAGGQAKDTAEERVANQE